MWYFAWMLGVGFALLLAILNAMWGENEAGRAMSVAFVRGVGFVPRMLVWRWLFSGWTCFAALAVAGWVKFLH